MTRWSSHLERGRRESQPGTGRGVIENEIVRSCTIVGVDRKEAEGRIAAQGETRKYETLRRV